MKSWHGTASGYKRHGCRCDECKDAKNKYEAEYRANSTERRERHNELIRQGKMKSWHGTVNGYKAHGCRCDECVAAHRKQRREYMVGKTSQREAQDEWSKQNNIESKVHARNHGDGWTDEHLEMITEPDRPIDRVLAKRIGRTIKAVRTMRDKVKKDKIPV